MLSPAEVKIPREEHNFQALDDSGLITDCTGPWGSLFLLAPNPHQEDYNDADFFFGDCLLVIGLSMTSLEDLNLRFPRVPILSKNLGILAVFCL